MGQIDLFSGVTLDAHENIGRGDRVDIDDSSAEAAPEAPSVLECTLRTESHQHTIQALSDSFPTCVGMVRTPCVDTSQAKSFPHMRGDGPYFDNRIEVLRQQEKSDG